MCKDSFILHINVFIGYEISRNQTFSKIIAKIFGYYTENI